MIIVQAEFDAEKQELKLSEPLNGFKDHEIVRVIVHHIDPDRPLLEFRGALAGKEGEQFANAVEDMFPTEK
jgi:hypothetical protein